MAIKVERRQVGIAGSGGLPGGSFGGGDVGSGLMRAGLSLMRQSQAKNEANQAIADRLLGSQDGYNRPQLNPDGTMAAPQPLDFGKSPEYNAANIAAQREARFDIFQRGAVDRITRIQSNPDLTAAEKQAQLQEFGQSYLDGVGADDAERGRFGNWLENTIQTTSSQLVEQENRQLFKLKVEGAESRIKRRTDEMTAAIASGDTKLVSMLQESIDQDFTALQGMLAISPDKRQAAQTQIYELARVTGMSRQVGSALATMEVDPRKVDAFLDAIKTGSDYKLEWTARDGRRWEIDTKKLGVADEGLKNQLIQNLTGTQNRMQKVWADMAENEAFLEFMQTKDPSVQLTPEQTKTFNSHLDQIMQANGIDKPQTWDMVTYWSSRAGAVPSNAVDSLISMIQSGDENQIALAAQAWNNIRAAQDAQTGKFIGNALAGSVPDDKARLLNSIADWTSLGFTPAQVAAARDKMFSGDKTFNETTGDALKAWGQVATADDTLEKSFDTELLNRWKKVAPDSSFGINMTVLGPNVFKLYDPSAPGPRMPPWWSDAVKQAYTVNFMINPSDPKAALDMAIKQVESQTIRSPIFKDSVARVADGNFQNLSKPGWLELGKDVVKGLTTNRGDGYDQLEQFVLSEIGLDETDPLSPDIPVIDVNDLMRITRDNATFDQKTGQMVQNTPTLGKDLTLHRIGGDYQNPQFEVWFKGSDGFYLPLKSADGGNLMIQPAGEWRMREARMAFDQKIAGLNEAQSDEIDALQKQKDQAFMERVNEYTRLNPGGLPGKDQIKMFDEQALEGFDVEKEAIEQGYRKLRDELELSAPVPEVTPKTSSPDPVVDRVRSVVTGNGEEAVAPYQPEGTPTINSNETGPYQGELRTESGISLDNVQPEVSEAAKLASSLFGQPLVVKSAYRDPKRNAKAGGAKGSEHMHGNALDISLVGLDDGARTKLVQSLRAAGFKRFIAYSGNTTLHVDMKDMGTGKIHPMFNKSIANMDQAPQWYKDGLKGEVPSIQQASAAPLPAASGDTYSSLVVPRSQGKDVAITAARAIDAVLPDGTGGSFLVNIASTESNFGKAGGTFRLKGDRGIWQINPGGAFAEVHRQLGIQGSKVAKAAAKLKETYGLDVAQAQFADMDKPLFGAAFARLYMIARGKDQIPTDINAQAGIWKKYYNTVLGAGKPEHFISKAVSMPQSVQQTAEVMESAHLPQMEATTAQRIYNSVLDVVVDPIRRSFGGDDQPLKMEDIFVSAKTIPDVTTLEQFEKIYEGKRVEDNAALNEIVDKIFPRTHFEGDARLMMLNLVQQAKTDPLMKQALKHMSGKRMVLYQNVLQKAPDGHPMGRRGFVLPDGRSAMGFVNRSSDIFVAPDPKSDPDAPGTIYHEALHKFLYERSRLDPTVPVDIRQRLAVPEWEHAMIYALQNEADGTKEKKIATSQKVDSMLQMLLGRDKVGEGYKTLKSDIDRLRLHYGN